MNILRERQRIIDLDDIRIDLPRDRSLDDVQVTQD